MLWTKKEPRTNADPELAVVPPIPPCPVLVNVGSLTYDEQRYLTYVAAQCFHGRGKMGLVHGVNGLVLHLGLTEYDRDPYQRPFLDNLAEVWIVTRGDDE